MSSTTSDNILQPWILPSYGDKVTSTDPESKLPTEDPIVQPISNVIDYVDKKEFDDLKQKVVVLERQFKDAKQKVDQFMANQETYNTVGLTCKSYIENVKSENTIGYVITRQILPAITCGAIMAFAFIKFGTSKTSYSSSYPCSGRYANRF